MPRHYTDDEKRLVLDRLIANHGDVTRTAQQFHLDASTIYRWQKQNELQNSDHSQLQYSQHLQHSASLPSPVTTGEGPGVGVELPPETTQAFQTLHDKLLAIADTLSNRIVEAIDDAPLNQRMTALSQLIDRIAKLAALLPEDAEPEPSGKPFEIDFDVEEKDDVYDEEETETISPSARSASLPEENSGKYSPF